MPLAIVTSNTQSKYSLLLTLNIVGVLACVCTIILLILTALGLIFPEPYISPVMYEHIRNFDNLAYVHMRVNDKLQYSIEDTFLYYITNIDMLILSEY